MADMRLARIMASAPDERAASVQSAERALHVVRMLAAADELRLSDVSRALDVAPSTAHRLLAALQAEGYAARTATGRGYVAGPAIRGQMQTSTQYDQAVIDLAADEMADLASRVGETVHLVRLRGRFTEFAAVALATRATQAGSLVGVVMPAQLTSGGKAMLATLRPTLVDYLFFEADWSAPSTSIIRCIDDLHAQLAITRERGWGANDGETPSAVRAVAAAIADPSGTARAAIVVIAPTNRLPLDDLPLVAEEVVASAKRVERSCSGAALVRAADSGRSAS